MKKIILAVAMAALVALMVPTTFAAPGYLGNVGPDTSHPVDWETTDGGNSTGPFEVKGENYNWPASYDFVTAATIRVRMEIGFWIELKTKDMWLTLHQVEIHKYDGFVNVEILCNTNIEVQGVFALNQNIIDLGTGLEVDQLKLNDGGDKCTVNANAGGTFVKVYLKLKNANLTKFTDAQVGTCLEIGKMTLKVRPLVRPRIAGAC